MEALWTRNSLNPLEDLKASFGRKRRIIGKCLQLFKPTAGAGEL